MYIIVQPVPQAKEFRYIYVFVEKDIFFGVFLLGKREITNVNTWLYKIYSVAEKSKLAIYALKCFVSAIK